MVNEIYWSVVWNMAFMTFHILGISYFFRGIGTTNQILLDCPVSTYVDMYLDCSD